MNVKTHKLIDFDPHGPWNDDGSALVTHVTADLQSYIEYEAGERVIAHDGPEGWDATILSVQPHTSTKDLFRIEIKPDYLENR